MMAITILVIGSPAWAFTPVDCEQARDDRTCVACNIYHESRGEIIPGQMLVALVNINRVFDDRFPESICEVTWQRRWVDNYGYVAQFSWTWDGKSDKTSEPNAWKLAWDMAGLVIESMHDRNYRISSPKLKCDPLWYHNQNVSPAWAKKLMNAGTIGNHTFYCDPEKLVLGE